MPGSVGLQEAWHYVDDAQPGVAGSSSEVLVAQVLLDGKPWFSCPGSKKQRVLSGEHAIVGEKAGYMTISRRVVVAGGSTASEKIALLPIESVVKLEYPTPRWIPWTVAGGGGAIALGGLGFWFAGRNQMDQFEADFGSSTRGHDGASSCE